MPQGKTLLLRGGTKLYSIFIVFLSFQKQIPIKISRYRKYYTTAISVEALHKYQDRLILLGVYSLERQDEIRTILYTPNSIYLGNANIPPAQEKLAYAYQAVINFMLNRNTKKKKSSKNNFSINSFYVDNNVMYGIQTIHDDKTKSFITKVYKYSTESDRWELHGELKHEVDSEDEDVGIIIHAADLIGPYIIRAETVMSKSVIQQLLSNLKTKSSKAIENEEYELEISARVMVVDISTLNYVTALEHIYYIKEKLKWLNEIIISYGADKKETYIKIIKEAKKIKLDDVFKAYIKSVRLRYSYLNGQYSYAKNKFSNLVVEPVLIVENELDTIATVVIKNVLDLGSHKIDNIVHISNVLATNIVMAVENKSKKITSYFHNPKLRGFSNDGRIFCYYAILEKTINDQKIKTPVTVIHAWDNNSGAFYQYVYDKDAARSIIAYIEDKHTKTSVGIVFSTYKEGYIVIALIDTKNKTIIIQEFNKTYQSILYTNLSNIVRIFCGKRYTVNKLSVGEFAYHIKKGEVITAFKVKRFYDNVEVNYWNSLCKRYIVISDHPEQQCSVYMPNLRGNIKEDAFIFLHDEIEMPILGTRRIIKRENNTCIFFELHKPVLIIRGPDLSSL